MNLIDDSLETQSKKEKSKKMARIILVFIILLIIAIIGIFGTIYYLQSKTLRLYIDGIQNDKVKEMMLEEADGTIYFPIKEVAKYFGYQSFNGDYTDKSEDASKCYVQCDDEVANFTLNSKKIYKLTTSDSDANFEYYYINKPVKAINGNLYTTIEGLEEAFNISFNYNTDTQRIYIYTMPYLIENYASKVLDYGYEEISENFINKKAVLNNMLVVSKNEGKIYGVIDVEGNNVIEGKYTEIEYLPNSGDFLVKNNNKVGIISSKRETKVGLLYDSLQLIDSDLGLYLAQKDDKYGVIDSKGNIKIYIEYDELGVDSEKFANNEIKNSYLLDNGMILARKGEVWGAFDKNGNEVVSFEYDSFGYVASTNKDAINLLLIPEYNVLVACKNKKYTLINSSGENLCATVLDDVYMTISSGKRYYYMSYNDKQINVEEYLNQLGVSAKKTGTNNSSQDNDNGNNTTENETTNNTQNSTKVTENNTNRNKNEDE